MAFIHCAVTLLVMLTVNVAPVSATSPKPWNELVFTQSWPKSFCKQIQIQKTHTCFIPENITTWNVHGVWPTENGSMGPSYCNKSDPFNAAKLLPIRDQLLKYWGNLFQDQKPEQFWAHEWTKHGTCAESLGKLNSELKYFSVGLCLNRKYDLLKILAQSGIVPGTNATYKLVNIVAALKKVMGVTPKVYCFLDEAKPRHQYLIQVEFCLDPTFELIKCMHKPRDAKEWHTHSVYNSIDQHMKNPSKHAQNQLCLANRETRYPAI